MNITMKNMREWLNEIKETNPKKAMPVLSFPGMQLIGTDVDKLVRSGKLQADCMKAIADEYDTLASVSLMDLSVEAEAFGSSILYSDDEVPTVVGRIIETQEDADNLKIPAVGDMRTGEYVKTIEYASKLITDRPVLAGAIGPFSLSGRLMDMSEIMVACMIEPELVATILEKATAFIIEYVLAFKKAGAGGVVLAEPAAGLLSPDLNRIFSVPYVKRIVDAVSDDNFTVVYHNCGNTIPLINDILTIGAGIYHFGNAIKMDEMLKLVPGDVLVSGNIEPSGQFRNGTKESITAATTDMMERCARYSNFIPSSGCDIPPQTAHSQIRAFFDAIDSFYDSDSDDLQSA